MLLMGTGRCSQGKSQLVGSLVGRVQEPQAGVARASDQEQIVVELEAAQNERKTKTERQKIPLRERDEGRGVN